MAVTQVEVFANIGVYLEIILSNQIFHYTCCIMQKPVASWRGPSLHHCARATQLLSKKCLSGGKPLATLCPI